MVLYSFSAPDCSAKHTVYPPGCSGCGVYVRLLLFPLFVSMMTVTLSASRRPINALNPECSLCARGTCCRHLPLYSIRNHRPRRLLVPCLAQMLRPMWTDARAFLCIGLVPLEQVINSRIDAAVAGNRGRTAVIHLSKLPVANGCPPVFLCWTVIDESVAHADRRKNLLLQELTKPLARDSVPLRSPTGQIRDCCIGISAQPSRRDHPFSGVRRSDLVGLSRSRQFPHRHDRDGGNVVQQLTQVIWLRCASGPTGMNLEHRVVVAEFPSLRQHHDRRRCELFCDRADIGRSLRSEIGACRKVRFSKPFAVNGVSMNLN